MFKIKMAGIYKIEHISGYYYIGMSVDIFSRWSSHYTSIKMKTHSSTAFMELWNSTNPPEWSFSILENISITKHKEETGLKGKSFENSFRKLLLNKEKEYMKLYSINFSLNKSNKHFS